MLPDVFNTHRPLLFSVAYRMLGSASDAEDVLQDAWLRYRGAEHSAIRSPKAFATTIVTRLCLDRLKSARATREQYRAVAAEPVLTSEVEGPDARLQRGVGDAGVPRAPGNAVAGGACRIPAEGRLQYDHSGSRTCLARPWRIRGNCCTVRRLGSRKGPRLTGTARSRREVAERFARVFVGRRSA